MKEKADGSGELTTVPKVPSLTPNTAIAKIKSSGGTAAKLRSKSSLQTPLHTPPLAAGSGNMDSQTMSGVQPSAMRRRNKNGSSSLKHLHHKSPIKKTQGPLNAVNLITNAGKVIEMTSHSGQMKTRSKFLSLNSLSLAEKPDPTCSLQKYIPINPKQNKRFYEALIMLSVLGRSH